MVGMRKCFILTSPPLPIFFCAVCRVGGGGAGGGVDFNTEWLPIEILYIIDGRRMGCQKRRNSGGGKGQRFVWINY